jgi:signal transduction histidine kinase
MVQAPEDGPTAEMAADKPDGPEFAGAKRILAAADADRRRFAQDLHDGAQQKFVAAVTNLQLARTRFASQPDRAREHLDAALAQAESGLSALRDLVAGIHPPILTHLGLQAAVESLADGLPIPVSLEIGDGRLPPAIEETVYYFVAEALTNVIKHARAGEATVMIDVSESILTVEVSDDGIGGAIPTSGSAGLVGLMDRMQAMEGVLTVASPPSGGTVLRGVLPLSAETD